MRASSNALVEYFASAQDFDEIKSIMKNDDCLPATYADWLVIAERRERMLSRKGHGVIRAYIVPDAFREFCRLRASDTDCESFLKFTASLLA